MSEQICKCCGQIFEPKGVNWNRELGTLFDHGIEVILTRNQTKIFDVLYRRMGGAISVYNLMGIVYADDPNGGAEDSTVIAGYIRKIRKRLVGTFFKIKVQYGTGYFLEYSGGAK